MTGEGILSDCWTILVGWGDLLLDFLPLERGPPTFGGYTPFPPTGVWGKRKELLCFGSLLLLFLFTLWVLYESLCLMYLQCSVRGG